VRPLSALINTLSVASDFIRLLITSNAKRASDTIGKSLVFFSRLYSSLIVHATHQKLLGLMFSFIIIAFIYSKVSSAEELGVITCPDGYAYEDLKGVYIPCEKWDEYARLSDNQQDYKHLILTKGRNYGTNKRNNN